MGGAGAEFGVAAWGRCSIRSPTSLLIAAALMMLVYYDDIRGWVIIPALIILAREILVSGMREFLATIAVQVPVSSISKLKTVLQVIALAMLIVAPAIEHVWGGLHRAGIIALWAAAVLTIYTGFSYVQANLPRVGRARAASAQGRARGGADVVKLLYFAWVRQKVGRGEEAVDVPREATTVGALATWLAARGGGYAEAFADLKRVRAALNQDHVDFARAGEGGRRSRVLSAGHGRMSVIRVQREDFEPGAEIARLQQARRHRCDREFRRCGARREPRREARQHDAGALSRHDGARVGAHRQGGALALVAARRCVVHRVGELKPGERIVLVVTAAAHRRAAFEAAEFLMDYLKTRAPFWKRELRASGEHWVEPRGSDDDAAARWKRD